MYLAKKIKLVLYPILITLCLTGCVEKEIFQALRDKGLVVKLGPPVLSGTYAAFYQNGQKKVEGGIRNDQREGLYTWWYENGQKKAEGFYKKGEITGLWTSWYAQGQKESERIIKNGKISGLVTLWTEQGHKKVEVNY
jgi:hypothetical protein